METAALPAELYPYIKLVKRLMYYSTAFYLLQVLFSFFTRIFLKKGLFKSPFSVSKKSTRCETAEKECRLGDGKFVAVQRYGRVCCRLKQKAVAHATALSFFYSRFKIIFLHRSIIFCGLCLYRQSDSRLYACCLNTFHFTQPFLP